MINFKIQIADKSVLKPLLQGFQMQIEKLD